MPVGGIARFARKPPAQKESTPSTAPPPNDAGKDLSEKKDHGSAKKEEAKGPQSTWETDPSMDNDLKDDEGGFDTFESSWGGMNDDFDFAEPGEDIFLSEMDGPPDNFGGLEDPMDDPTGVESTAESESNSQGQPPKSAGIPFFKGRSKDSKSAESAPPKQDDSSLTPVSLARTSADTSKPPTTSQEKRNLDTSPQIANLQQKEEDPELLNVSQVEGKHTEQVEAAKPSEDQERFAPVEKVVQDELPPNQHPAEKSPVAESAEHVNENSKAPAQLLVEEKAASLRTQSDPSVEERPEENLLAFGGAQETEIIDAISEKVSTPVFTPRSSVDGRNVAESQPFQPGAGLVTPFSKSSGLATSLEPTPPTVTPALAIEKNSEATVASPQGEEREGQIPAHSKLVRFDESSFVACNRSEKEDIPLDESKTGSENDTELMPFEDIHQNFLNTLRDFEDNEVSFNDVLLEMDVALNTAHIDMLRMLADLNDEYDNIISITNEVDETVEEIIGS